MKDKRSLKTEIRFFVYQEYPDFVNGGRIERLASDLRYKASNASRRARELEREGIFERRLNRGSVEYRYSENLLPRITKVEVIQKLI